MKRAAKLVGMLLLVLGLPALSKAQLIEQQSCPSGTVPISAPGTTTINNTNGQILRQWCVDNNGNMYSTGHIHSGTETFGNINTSLFIGGPTPQVGVSPDIGAQINAAYASLPSTGGKIFLLPKTGGGCYDYSSPVLLNTSGKYVSIEGLFTGNQTGGTNQGVCLNYTPTTATTAFTIDYTPSAGGGYTGYPALSNVIISNNSCITVGGCGSSATGLALGVSNGAHFATIKNAKISGFSNGITINQSNGWGQLFEQVSVVYNNIGINPTVIMENVRFVGGTVSVNATGVQCTTNSGLTFDSVSFDANSVVALNNANCNVAFIAPWFENSGVSNAQYITQSIGQFTITGGFILDDNNSGTIAQHITVTGGFFDIRGLNVFSAGQTVTNLVNNTAGGTGGINWFAISPSLDAPGTTTSCSIAYTCQVSKLSGGATPLEIPVLSLPFVGSGNPSCAGLGGITNLLWNNPSTNKITFCNNGGSATAVSGTVANGTATMTTALIAAGACGTTVTVAATGVLTTDAIEFSRNAAATAANGGSLTLNSWPTSGNVNFNYCNPTAAGITPTAMTVNWTVVR